MASSVRTKGCKFCPKHPTKELILICTQCNNEPVCLTCISTLHIGHNSIVDLDIIAQEKYNLIQDISDTIEKENIPTIRNNLQIAEEKVKIVEHEILSDIEHVEEHHRSLRDLLKQNATAAISKMKATIESNKQLYETFESESEQNIETLKGRIIRNTETCKSKNNILTLDEAKELENVKFEIPTFEMISTDHFYPGGNPGAYITAAFGSIVHNDEQVPIAIPIETENEITPQKQSSLLDLGNDQSNPCLKTDTPVPKKLHQFGKKKTQTTPPVEALTENPNISEENGQCSSPFNHPHPIKLHFQLENLGEVYKKQQNLHLQNPVFFNNGMLCCSDSYMDGYLTCIDSSGSDCILPLSTFIQNEKVQSFCNKSINPSSSQLLHMAVNPLDDKLYLMMLDSKTTKTIWSLDRHTEEMVKLFDVKETSSKFAILSSGDILIGCTCTLETDGQSLVVKGSVYSQTGACIKTYSIPVKFGSNYEEYRDIYIKDYRHDIKRESKMYKGSYSKLEWKKGSIILNNICVCPITGMVAIGVCGQHTEYDTQKGIDIYFKEINLTFKKETIFTDVLLLDVNFNLMYRKHDFQSTTNPHITLSVSQSPQSLQIAFDRFGHLLLIDQQNHRIDICKATTGQHIKRFNLTYNIDKYCCLNSDSNIIVRNNKDNSLQIFRYIY